MPLSATELAGLVRAGIVTPQVAAAIDRYQTESGRTEAAPAAVPAETPGRLHTLPLATADATHHARTPRFDITHTAYYVGVFLVMGALGWYMTKALAAGEPLVLVMLSLAYGVAFLWGGEKLWTRPDMTQPAGLLFTLAVWMVPLFLYGVIDAGGSWQSISDDGYQDYFSRIKGQWVMLEVATLSAAAFMMKHRRFPFLMFPIAFAGWFLAMDLAALAGGAPLDGGERRVITALVALLMLGIAIRLEGVEKGRFAFWLHLFGLLGLWGAIAPDGPGNVAWVLLSLLCMGGALALGRRTWMVFGAIGLHVWLARLAFDVFRDSMLFPLVLSVIGVLLIASGMWYARNGAELERRLRDIIGLRAPTA